MNIGSIAKNSTGHLVGKISTLTVELVVALRPVHSQNPNAPKFEVMALSAARAWVRVGALFELASKESGLIFLNGKIEDPSLSAPLYVRKHRIRSGEQTITVTVPGRPAHAGIDPYHLLEFTELVFFHLLPNNIFLNVGIIIMQKGEWIQMERFN